MQDVKAEACLEIAHHLRVLWPREQQVEEMAKGIDGILVEYDIPPKKLIELLYFLPKGSNLSLDGVRKWAKRYSEERELVLRGLPKR